MPKKQPKKTVNFLEFNHARRVAIVAGTTVGTVIAFGLLGYFLDQKLGTQPWLLVVSVLISFPFTQYLLIKKMKKLADDEMK